MKIIKRIVTFLLVSISATAQVENTGVIQALVFHECVNEGIKFRVKPLTPFVDDDYLIKLEDVSTQYDQKSVVNFYRLDKYAGIFMNVNDHEQAHVQITVTRKGYPAFSYKAYSTTCNHSGLPTNCPENTREVTINRMYPEINQLIDVEWKGEFSNPTQFLNWYNVNTSANALPDGKVFEGVLTDYPAVFHAQPSQRNNECHGWTELYIGQRQPLTFEQNTAVSISDFKVHITADTLTETPQNWVVSNTTFNSNAFSQCKKALRFSGNSSISNTSFNLGDEFTIGMWLNAATLSESDSLGNVLVSYLENTGSRADGFSIGLSPTGNLKLVARKNNVTVNSSDGNTSLATSLPLNQWRYLTFTYDGMDLKVYVNGELKERKRIGIGTPENKTLKFGDSIFGQHGFVGMLDEIKLFNRSLSAIDVQNLWAFSNQPTSLATLNVSSVVTKSKTEESGTIISTEQIQAGDVYYKASQLIDLQAGFDSKTNGIFEAKISGCDN